VSCGDSFLLIFTGGSDPDGDELYYIFYYSFTDPEGSFETVDYYNQLHIFDIYDGTGAILKQTSYRGPIYFWATTYDGGRESGYTPVVSVTVPGTQCEYFENE